MSYSKKHERFSARQQQGSVELHSGRTMFWNFFDNDVKIDIALIGDSLLRDICTNGMCVYSIPGEVVEDFLAPDVLDHLFCYKIVILGSIGGNNITTRSGKGAEKPDDVLKKTKLLVGLLSEKNITVIVNTLTQRHGGHDWITEYNQLLLASELISHKVRGKLYSLDCWQDDRVHLTLKGRRDFCKSLKELQKSF